MKNKKSKMITFAVFSGIVVIVILLVVSFKNMERKEVIKIDPREPIEKRFSDVIANLRNLTAREKLERMKEAYRENDLAKAVGWLDSIPRGTPEYREAEKLENKRKIDKRINFASELRTRMLDNQIEFTSHTTGNNQTVLVCRFVILTDVLIHHLEKQFRPDGVKELGFKQVLLRDKLGGEYILWEDK